MKKFEFMVKKTTHAMALWIVLCAGWIILSAVYLVTSDFSPTIISYDHSGEYQDFHSRSVFGTSQEWTGTFTAKENYLGIVAIRFAKTQKPIIDTLTFMIREKGQEDWYEQNNYDSRQFYYLEEFPFGFLTIADSKGKKYEFKFITSTTNEYYSKVLSEINPVVVTKYKYPKEVLLSHPYELAVFASKKITSTLRDGQNQKVVVLYGVPVIYYTVFLLLVWCKLIDPRRIRQEFDHFRSKLVLRTHEFEAGQRNTINRVRLSGSLGRQALTVKNTAIALLVLATILDIFVVQSVNDVLAAALLGLWIGYAYVYKANSKLFFLISLLLAFLMPLLHLLGFIGIVTKLADWLYYFLCLGTLHALIEAYVYEN